MHELVASLTCLPGTKVRAVVWAGSYLPAGHSRLNGFGGNPFLLFCRMAVPCRKETGNSTGIVWANVYDKAEGRRDTARISTYKIQSVLAQDDKPHGPKNHLDDFDNRSHCLSVEVRFGRKLPPGCWKQLLPGSESQWRWFGYVQLLRFGGSP